MKNKDGNQRGPVNETMYLWKIISDLDWAYGYLSVTSTIPQKEDNRGLDKLDKAIKQLKERCLKDT